MPSISLDLGRILLTTLEDNIQLSAICAARINLPQSIAKINPTDLVAALTSGHVWISRAAGCSMNIQVLCNGKALHYDQRANLLSSIGRRICDAQPWPQFSLCSELDVNAIPTPGICADILIAIKHNASNIISEKKPGPRTWVLDQSDVIPPDGIVLAQLESMELKLDFLTVGVSREIKPQLDADEDDDIDLLGQGFVDNVDNHHSEFENTIRNMEILPKVITSIFAASTPSHLRTMPQTQTMLQTVPGTPRSHLSELSHRRYGRTPKGARFSSTAIQYMRRWLEAHSSDPHPTRPQKEILVAATGLTKSQIAAWMNRNRKTICTSTRISEDEMLLSSALPDDESAGISSPAVFSQSSSQTSIATSIATENICGQDEILQEPIRDQNLPLVLSGAGYLVDTTMQIVIGGCYPHMRIPNTISIEKDTPELPLSRLVPSMFNPGYRKLIAHHSRFLSAIVQTLSVTSLKNCQVPALQAKFRQLAKLPLSKFHESLGLDEEGNRYIDTDTNQLSKIIQTRIFAMMQATLYNPLPTRQIWKRTTNSNGTGRSMLEDEDQDPELLDADHDGKMSWSKTCEGQIQDEQLAQFTTDEEDDDLLLEYGLDEEEDYFYDLLDKGERERLETERETDEMLLDDEWQELVDAGKEEENQDILARDDWDMDELLLTVSDTEDDLMLL